MQAILLLALLGLMHSARTFAPQPLAGSGAAGVVMAGGFLLLTALFAGNIAKGLHVPRLTGYLMLGIVVGPQVLGLVSERMLADLRIFNGVAIALIALTAGTEMDLKMMRPLFRGIGWITGVGVVGTGVALAGAAFAMREWLPFLQSLDIWQAAAVAGVLGTTMASQSPAVVVALRKELNADGPVSRTVLGVVIVSDLVVIVFFALTSTLARSVLAAPGTEAAGLGTLVWEVLGSAVVGVLIGVVVSAFLRSLREGGALFVVMVGFLTAEVGQRVHLDPLLVALAAGIFIRNATSHGDRLHHEIEAASLPVYISFFAVAGATIHLDVLATVGVPAVAFVLVRAAGFLTGSNVGARLAGSDEAVRKYAGFGLLPQAGLALALASLFTRSFPQLGPEAGALVFGVVALNEMFAPIVYRWALARSGEARVVAEEVVVARLAEGETV